MSQPLSAGESARLPRRKRRHSVTAEIFGVMLVAIVLSFFLKTFLVQAFFIPSGSMLNTLQLGDRILVDKLTPELRDVKRGDIVVFNDPENWLPDAQEEPVTAASMIRGALEFIGLAPARTGDDLVKRVIGVEGDRVVCCTPQGRITVNGVAIEEPYLYPGDAASAQPFDITVEPGKLWVMGDHRSDSQDSRAHRKDETKGMVPVDKVVGRALVVVWPFENLGRITRPDSLSDPRLDAG